MNIEEVRALSDVLADEEQQLLDLKALEGELYNHFEQQRLIMSLSLIKMTVVLTLCCWCYAAMGGMLYMLGYFRYDALALYLLVILGVVLAALIFSHNRISRQFRQTTVHPKPFYDLQQLTARKKVNLSRLEQIKNNLDAGV